MLFLHTVPTCRDTIQAGYPPRGGRVFTYSMDNMVLKQLRVPAEGTYSTVCNAPKLCSVPPPENIHYPKVTVHHTVVPPLINLRWARPGRYLTFGVI